MTTYTIELLLSGNNTLKVDVKADCEIQACAIATSQFRGKNQVAYITSVKEKYRVFKRISIALVLCAICYPFIF